MKSISNILEEATKGMSEDEKNVFTVIATNAVVGTVHAVSKMVRAPELITVIGCKIKPNAPETGDLAIFLGIDGGAEAVMKLAKAAYQYGPDWVDDLEIDESGFAQKDIDIDLDPGEENTFDIRRN